MVQPTFHSPPLGGGVGGEAVVSPDGNDILAHEARSGQEFVHKMLVAEVAVVFGPVVNAIPRLYANKWRLFAVWAPDAHGRGLEIKCYLCFAIGIEQLYVLDLTVVEYHRVVFEALLGERPHPIFGFHLLAPPLVNTSADVSEEPDGFRVVKLQAAFEWFAGQQSGHVERGMPTDLEEDGLVVGVLHVPHHMNFVIAQLVAHA